jgi:isocitrate dehydrogenase
LEDCIAELRSKGYDVPLYPREPKDDADRDIAAKYATVPEISTILLVIL